MVRPLLVALFLAALAAPVAHGATTRITTKPLLDDGVVQPGKDDGFWRRCPKSAPHPVGWQVFGRQADGAIALDEANVFGRGLERWDGGVLGMGDQPTAYSIGPICLRAPGRFAYPTRTGALDPGQSGTWAIGCPKRAPHAISGSLEPQTDADVGRTVMTASVQADASSSPRRWAVGVRNVSSTASAFWVGAVCTSAPARYITRFSDPLTVQPQQTDGGRGTCPRLAPHPIAGTFYPMDDSGEGQFTLDEVVLYGRRDIQIQATNRAATPQRLVVGDVCIGDRHPARQRPPLRRVDAASRPRISGST